MSKSKNEGRSLMIRPEGGPLWMRIYRRREKYFALLNFAPSAYPLFVDKIEGMVRLEQVSNYPDAAMGALVFGVAGGVPVAALHELLLKTSAMVPVPVVHHAKGEAYEES